METDVSDEVIWRFRVANDNFDVFSWSEVAEEVD